MQSKLFRLFNAVQKVSFSPTISLFYSKNKMSQVLAGQKIILKDESKANAEEYLNDKVVGLYFSAMWCPPCRAFTPKLKKFYEDLKAAGKNFEVIFVSRDRTANDLKEYYNDHHGAWTYLEFGDPKIDEFLSKYEVKTIPTFRIIKPDGTVVIEDARTEVQEKGVENALALWDEWMGKYNA
uniref:Thioredoxin domain-containing protein n=1 Tax=Meloidogyne enterolobii TaxID=390850 RepID=A0A6V7USC4_MELEN|nr:unnamed protein product [Meloidogyne enterolobii]